MNIEKYLIKQAKKKNRTIVFPEAAFSDRIIEAAKIITKKKIAKVVLIADESALVMRFKKLKGITIVSPKSSEATPQLAEKLYEYRKHKGMTLEQAKELILDPFYFATMMVKEGLADGMLGGAEVSTAQNLKPALEIIKAKQDIASSFFVFTGKHKSIQLPLFLSDAGLIENPDSETLAKIASQTVSSVYNLFDIEAKVAFLSYSTKGSAKSQLTEKVKSAFNIFANKNPKIICDGELQLDSAIIKSVSQKKCPESILNGEANTLIVPDLNVGNNLYKAMQYFGELKAIGPVVQGLNKPVNDLSRGCKISDIVLLCAVTVLQCE